MSDLRTKIATADGITEIVPHHQISLLKKKAYTKDVV